MFSFEFGDLIFFILWSSVLSITIDDFYTVREGLLVELRRGNDLREPFVIDPFFGSAYSDFLVSIYKSF